MTDEQVLAAKSLAEEEVSKLFQISFDGKVVMGQREHVEYAFYQYIEEYHVVRLQNEALVLRVAELEQKLRVALGVNH